MVKDFTQKIGNDYKKTFSLVSKKDSLRIIMDLVGHYDLDASNRCENYFLEWKFRKKVYMDQSEGFSIKEKEHMI